MRHVMVVLTDPVPGQEDEYNRWYTETHIPELLQTPGLVSAQRFRLADAGGGDSPHSYLAIYEAEGELDDIRAAIAERAPRRTPPPSAMSTDRALWWFSAITDRITQEP